MKQKLLATCLCMAVSSAAAWAQESETEETIINKPERVTVKRDRSNLSITIDGREGNPDYRYTNSFVIDDGSTQTMTETENKRQWDFSLPFQDVVKNLKNPHAMRRRFHRPNMSGVGFGLVAALGTPTDMNVAMASSYEVPWTIFTMRFMRQNSQQRWSFGVGFGLNWRNYRMTGMKRFFRDNLALEAGDYPQDAVPGFSRIRVFSIMIPFTVGYSLNRYVDLQFGPVLNFNTSANVKTRYTLNEQKQKETFGNIHQSPVTIDLQAKLSYRQVGWYVKYSPFHVLDTSFGPSFCGLSTGIMLEY